ncbi:helix-turn-helix transcriptional regulator [Arthrobacter alpinus]|nr:helix-turn-helix transcriptional regulator [Arthrobacter alpinus]
MAFKYAINHVESREHRGVSKRTLHPEAAKALGRRLSTRREELGKTQQQVADFAGMSRGYYRTLERGSADYAHKKVSNPTITMVIDLAQVLQLQPAELIEIVVNHHGTVESKAAKPSPSEPSEHPQR